MSQSKALTIIIVEKDASLKTLTVKDYKVEELYKKCGFKKADGFNCQVEWTVKLNGQRYYVQMYGKQNGKANSENKYDFPPPVDTTLYFGACALVCSTKDATDVKIHTHLTLDLWNQIYEKLFGGFEDLAATAKEDEEEEDELENVPKHMKTKKGGYLKDGFVVDSSETEDDAFVPSNEDEQSIEDSTDIGSELSEEEYDYDDDKK